MLRDLVRALSLANLCFIIAWNDLLNAPIRRFNLALAIVVNILLFGALFWGIAILLRRRNNRLAIRSARFVFPLIVLLPLNGILDIVFPTFILLNALLILVIALVVIGLYEIMPWHRYIIRAADTILIILFPFFVIAIGQALWVLIHPPSVHTLQAATRENHSKKRVLLLLFDEMDEYISFVNRPATLNMPHLDQLRSESFFATNVYAPADSTPVSIPSILTGKLLSNSRLVNQSKMVITIADTGSSLNLANQPNLFTKARADGFRTNLVGWYIPYCSLIGGSLDECTWIDTDAVTLDEAFSKQIWDLACTIPIVSKIIVARGLEIKKHADRRRVMESYLRTLDATTRAIADPNFGLVFVHWPVPHPPGIYNRQNQEFELDAPSSYLDNLKLVDQALGKVRDKMETDGTWDHTIVLLTSDHWWRTQIWKNGEFWSAEDKSTQKDESDHRVPFLLKLPNQKVSLRYDSEFNNILIHDLILALLRGELSSATDVGHWLDQNRSIGESPYRFEVTQASQEH
jgi:Sulfatase